MTVKINGRVEKFCASLDNLVPLHIDWKIFYRDASAEGYTSYKSGVFFGLTTGNRYSPPDEFPALYLSSDSTLCTLEVAHHAVLLSPATDIAEIVSAIHAKIPNLSEIQSLLIDNELEHITTDLDNLAQKYDFLTPYNNQPELLKELLLSKPSDFLTQTPALTSRIKFPVSLKANVLDLTDQSVLRCLHLSAEDLRCPTVDWKSAHETLSWTVCQDIGRAVWLNEKFEGILFPSSLTEKEKSSLVKSDKNIMLFMDVTNPSAIRGNGAHKLIDDFIDKCNHAFLE